MPEKTMPAIDHIRQPEPVVSTENVIHAIRDFADVTRLMDTPLSYTATIKDIQPEIKPSAEDANTLSQRSAELLIPATVRAHQSLQEANHHLSNYTAVIEVDFLPRVNQLVLDHEGSNRASIHDLERSQQHIRTWYDEGGVTNIQKTLQEALQLPIGERAGRIEEIESQFFTALNPDQIITIVEELRKISTALRTETDTTLELVKTTRSHIQNVITTLNSEAIRLDNVTPLGIDEFTAEDSRMQEEGERIVCDERIRNLWRGYAGKLDTFLGHRIFTELYDTVDHLPISLGEVEKFIQENIGKIRQQFHALINEATQENHAIQHPSQDTLEDAATAERTASPFAKTAQDTILNTQTPPLPEIMSAAVERIKAAKKSNADPDAFNPNASTFAFDATDPADTVALEEALTKLDFNVTLYEANIHGQKKIILFPAVLDTGMRPTLSSAIDLEELGRTGENNKTGEREFIPYPFQRVSDYPNRVEVGPQQSSIQPDASTPTTIEPAVQTEDTEIKRKVNIAFEKLKHKMESSAESFKPEEAYFGFKDDPEGKTLNMLKELVTTLPQNVTIYKVRGNIVVFPAVLDTGMKPNLPFKDELHEIGRTGIDSVSEKRKFIPFPFAA